MRQSTSGSVAQTEDTGKAIVVPEQLVSEAKNLGATYSKDADSPQFTLSADEVFEATNEQLRPAALEFIRNLAQLAAQNSVKLEAINQVQIAQDVTPVYQDKISMGLHKNNCLARSLIDFGLKSGDFKIELQSTPQDNKKESIMFKLI